MSQEELEYLVVQFRLGLACGGGSAPSWPYREAELRYLGRDSDAEDWLVIVTAEGAFSLPQQRGASFSPPSEELSHFQ